ncbi:hypothetical protein ACFQ0B_02630 [Nonomuraea thailandensis]
MRDADLLIVHDHRLLRALPYRRPPVVWDVREQVTPRQLARAGRRHRVITPSVVPEATLVSPSPPLLATPGSCTSAGCRPSAA